jgi:hypothetical protein
LNVKNRITVTGELAVLELSYSFGISNIRLEEIKKILRKTRTILIMYKMHHPNADTNKLYVTKKAA